MKIFPIYGFTRILQLEIKYTAENRLKQGLKV